MNVTPSRGLVAGIFVGGASRRMGGTPKGLLRHPSKRGTLIDHIVGLARSVGASPVLVGAHPAYRHLGLPVVEDALPGIGPVGGLLGLLRAVPDGVVLAIANDLPFVSRALLEALVARFADGEPALLPKRGERLEALCAIYRPALMLGHVERAVAAGEHGLQRIARRAGADVFELEGAMAACLDDWDTPHDVAGS